MPEVVLAPTTGPQGLPSSAVSVRIQSGEIYEWEYTDDSSLSDEFRYRVFSTAIAPTTPPSFTTLQDIASPPFVKSVAFDANAVYQATSSGVSRLALDGSGGGTPTPYFALPSNFDECSSLVITASTAYLVNHDVTSGTTEFYSLALPPSSAAATPTLIPNMGTHGWPLTDLTVIGNNLFWVENDLAAGEYTLYTAPTSGGAAVSLEPDVGTTSAAIATDGTYLYWDITNSVGTVRRAPLNSLTAASAITVTEGLDNAQEGIAVDAQYVYVMDTTYVVYRALKDGSGSLEQLGTGFISDANGDHYGDTIYGVDSSYVYMTLDDASVVRLPKVP